jgi:hypothetical protein
MVRRGSTVRVRQWLFPVEAAAAAEVAPDEQRPERQEDDVEDRRELSVTLAAITFALPDGRRRGRSGRRVRSRI